MKSVLITKYIFLHLPRLVCLGVGSEATHGFSHPSLSVYLLRAPEGLVHHSLPKSPGGVSDTFVHSSGRYVKEVPLCFPLPSGFPGCLLNKGVFLRIRHLCPRCCFLRFPRKEDASPDAHLLCPLGQSPSSTSAWGPPAPRPCCQPTGLGWGRDTISASPPTPPPDICMQRSFLLQPPNKSPQTMNSCRWTHPRSVHFARPDSTNLNLNSGSRWENHSMECVDWELI